MFSLTITGEGVEEATFSLEDLKTKWVSTAALLCLMFLCRFPKVDVTTVIQCNGNRREDFHYLDGKTPVNNIHKI